MHYQINGACKQYWLIRAWCFPNPVLLLHMWYVLKWWERRLSHQMARCLYWISYKKYVITPPDPELIYGHTLFQVPSSKFRSPSSISSSKFRFKFQVPSSKFQVPLSKFHFKFRVPSSAPSSIPSSASSFIQVQSIYFNINPTCSMDSVQISVICLIWTEMFFFSRAISGNQLAYLSYGGWLI